MRLILLKILHGFPGCLMLCSAHEELAMLQTKLEFCRDFHTLLFLVISECLCSSTFVLYIAVSVTIRTAFLPGDCSNAVLGCVCRSCVLEV